MGFLQRQHPRIHEAIMEMFALEAERARPRPGLDDEIVRFVEVFPIVGRVGVIKPETGVKT